MSKISYPFAAVPNQIARGGHKAIYLAVFVTLLSHGRSTASLSTLAKESGCSRKKVQEAIKYWIVEGPKHGITLNEEVKERVNTGTPNVYEIIIHNMTDTQVENDLGSRRTQVENDLRGRSKTTYPPRSKTTYKEEPIKKNPKEEPPTPKIYFSGNNPRGRKSEAYDSRQNENGLQSVRLVLEQRGVIRKKPALINTK